MSEKRHVSISLEKRAVTCVAVLLEDDAPRTCAALWAALPAGGAAFHAKYGNNEVYCLLPLFDAAPTTLENPTITPIPRDVAFFNFPPGHLGRSILEERGLEPDVGVIDLAVFYGRNNLLLNGAVGPVPCSVFGTIVENFEEMAGACKDVWRSGSVGEQLMFRRA